MKMKTVILSLLLFVLTACGSPEPTHETIIGETMLSQTFDSPDAWEVYSDANSDLKVVDGVYQIEVGDAGFIWGQNELKTEDVIIEVEATQLSDYDDNGYGIICRSDANNNGDGYYFLISGDGYASIRRGDGVDVLALTEWEKNSAINKGQSSNKIKAVCVGDYLALYVNDEFIVEATDSTFPSGFTALTAVAANGSDTEVTFITKIKRFLGLERTPSDIGTARITFDNLNIWKASLP